MIDNENTMNEPTIKPCPFCGGNAHFGTVRFGKNAVPKEDRNRVNHFVSCDLCNATTQTITGYGTQQEAADKWNTRDAIRAEPLVYRIKWKDGSNPICVLAHSDKDVERWLGEHGYIDQATSLTSFSLEYVTAETEPLAAIKSKDTEVPA